LDGAGQANALHNDVALLLHSLEVTSCWILLQHLDLLLGLVSRCAAARQVSQDDEVRVLVSQSLPAELRPCLVGVVEDILHAGQVEDVLGDGELATDVRCAVEDGVQQGAGEVLRCVLDALRGRVDVLLVLLLELGSLVLSTEELAELLVILQQEVVGVLTLVAVLVAALDVGVPGGDAQLLPLLAGACAVGGVDRLERREDGVRVRRADLLGGGDLRGDLRGLLHLVLVPLQRGVLLVGVAGERVVETEGKDVVRGALLDGHDALGWFIQLHREAAVAELEAFTRGVVLGVLCPVLAGIRARPEDESSGSQNAHETSGAELVCALHMFLQKKLNQSPNAIRRTAFNLPSEYLIVILKSKKAVELTGRSSTAFF